MVGNADGGPVDVRSSTAYAMRDRQPAGGGGTNIDVQILDVLPEDHNELRIRLWLPDLWLSPREMTVPAGATADVILTGEIYAAATAGTVTLTRFDPDWVEGEYLVVLGLEGTIQGTFHVPFLTDEMP